jgi:hypothetical protein
MYLFVTSQCNRNCPKCALSHLRSAKRYEIQWEELERFIHVSEQSGYRYRITLTGGEPLLWTHLREGVQRLKKSSICRSLVLATNAMDLRPLEDATAESIEYIRLSRYENNGQNIEELQRRYGSRVRVVDRRYFYDVGQPVKNTVPAVCGWPCWFYYDYRVYSCNHCLTYCPDYDAIYSNPLEVGYCRGLAQYRKTFGKDPNGPCSRCHVNKRYSAIMPRCIPSSG